MPLTAPEVRELLLGMVGDHRRPAGPARAWSGWRRAHRQRGRECHYRKRGARPPDG